MPGSGGKSGAVCRDGLSMCPRLRRKRRIAHRFPRFFDAAGCFCSGHPTSGYEQNLRHLLFELGVAISQEITHALCGFDVCSWPRSLHTVP